MCEELLDGYALRVLVFDLGDVLPYRVAQTKLALLDEDHDRRRGRDWLRQRRDIEDRIDCHLFDSRDKRAIAEGFSIYDLSLVPDDDDCTRKFFISDVSENDLLN